MQKTAKCLSVHIRSMVRPLFTVRRRENPFLIYRILIFLFLSCCLGWCLYLNEDEMARYDEDLHENIFFQTLVGKHGGLFNEAAENRWMVRF